MDEATNKDPGIEQDAYRSGQPVETPPIRAQELTKQFANQTVVDRVTFDVPRGTIFGFIGPSGCGKTTTVRMLTGIYQPTSGEVMVKGKEPGKLTQHDREMIGYMPQHFVLYPDLTIWENMSFAASIYGMGFGRSERLKELLQIVELWDDRNKRTRRVSGGMQRRLGLATTLVHEPDLLFLDEPTTGLDPVLRKKLWDYFHDLKEKGITVFVTTQYVSDAANCDLVGMMVDGKLAHIDTPERLRRTALGGDVVILSPATRIDYEHFQELSLLPFVTRAERDGEQGIRLTVHEAALAIPQLMDWSSTRGIEVESIQEYVPAFDDVFVALIHKEGQIA